MNTVENHIKVHIETPNHFMVSGESLWAKQVKGDLYSIENIPFAAYGINHGDVVKVIQLRRDDKPEVINIVERSGNRTIRIYFDKAEQSDIKKSLLSWLVQTGASYENGNGSQYAISIPQTVCMKAIQRRLDVLTGCGLEYETCEERVDGSFGDHPHDSPAKH